VLGPFLMVIFCCLTNILLITSLISLLSNTLTKASAGGQATRSPTPPISQTSANETPLATVQVQQHSRDEYLFV
jgi:hypothetical protein